MYMLMSDAEGRKKEASKTLQTTRQINVHGFITPAFCLGCAVLLCLVVCSTLLASFFFPSHLSLKHVQHTQHVCIYLSLVHVELDANNEQISLLLTIIHQCLIRVCEFLQLLADGIDCFLRCRVHRCL